MNKTTAKGALTARIEQETAFFDVAKMTTSIADLAGQQIRISVLTWAMDKTKEEIETKWLAASKRFNSEIEKGEYGKSHDLLITEMDALNEAHVIKTALA